jgi:hypothetical protein
MWPSELARELSATRIPSIQMRTFWMCSDVYWFSSTLIKSLGYVGAALGAISVTLYLVVPGLRVTEGLPHLLMIGSLLFSVIAAWAISLYTEAKRPGIATKLRQAPEEVSDFYD